MDLGIVLIVYIVQGLIFGVAVNTIIANKGYHENWFWGGFFFGIIALIVAASRPPKPYEPMRESPLLRRSGEQKGVSSGCWQCVFCNSINANNVTTCSCGKSREEAVNNLLTARRGKSHPAPAPLANDSITARLGSRLLPCLLYEMPFSIPRREALLENNRTKEALWELGLSGDRPIVLYEWENLPDRAVLDAYLQFWQMMRRYRLEFDFCVANLSDTIPLPKGVYRFQHIEPDLLQALKAAAKAIVSHQESLTLPQGTYHPAEIFPVEPKPVQLQNGFSVVGGVFGEGGFAVERVTPLPFSHVLANEKFGCLLQDAGLGFTWFENPQACCLTSGETDLSCGYNGERMLLSVGNRIYDICKGAKTFFSPELARYEGKAGEIDTRLEIRIDPTAAIQYLDVILENTGEKEEELVCAYGLEPVLGNHRNEASYIRFEQYHGNLLVHNPWQKESPCWMALRVSGEHPTYMVERAAFYSGDWQAQPLQSSHDPIAVLLVRKHLPPKGKETIRFLSAVTNLGQVQFGETALLLCDRIYTIEDNLGAVSRLFLNVIRSEALGAGFDIISCYCPLSPFEKLEHVFIPSLRIGFMTVSDTHSAVTDDPYKVIRSRRFTDSEALSHARKRIAFNRKTASQMLDQTARLLAEAKSLHDELEEYYRDAMDFDKVDQVAQKTVDQLLALV